MFRPLTTLRRWLRSRSPKDTLPVVPALPNYRPALTALEDRNAPGDILSGVLAAAIGGALLNPLDQLTAWVGSPVSGQPPATPAIGSTISVGAGTRTPSEEPAFRIPLAQPEGESAAVPGVSSAVEVAASLDDELLFVADPLAVTVFPLDATPTISPPAPTAEGVSVSTGTPAFGGGTVGVPRGTGEVGFLPQPPALQTPGEPGTAPGPELTVNNAYVADLPPNAAPVAADDTASVAEDGFVIIDVLANDTDADADDVVRIDSWDWKPAHGTVTQEEDGTLKYTPFPDYPTTGTSATDTFTYTATDGRDTSAPATVTVTITAVNDAPRAFNDAYRFTHGAPPYPNYPVSMPYTAVDSHSVIDNDTDADGLPAPNVQVDLTGVVGTINMNAWGTFSWYGPGTFYGQTSFKYRTTDYSGAWTNWATVQLWALSSAPSDGGSGATNDLFPIGEEGQTFDVTANDSTSGSGTFAVLASRPPAKQVTAFGFDGMLTYAPPSVGDLSATYRVFGAGGGRSAVATVTMPKVDLVISNGQDGAAVREENDDETKIGAFTVVNRNDTDGYGGRDFENKDPVTGQTKAVEAGNGTGVNEMDLMRLRVKKPTGFGANPADAITVEVTQGKARFFGTSYRETPLDTKLNITAAKFENAVNPTFIDYWVEVYEPSNDLRTVQIEMKWGAASDKVNATGIWVHFDPATGFHNGDNKVHTRAAEADDKTYQKSFDTFGMHPSFKLGQPGMMLYRQFDANGKIVRVTSHLRNTVEIEFVASPARVWDEPGVRFDVSRSVEVKVWDQKVADPNPVEMEYLRKFFPAFRERANDDPVASDEDPLPFAGSGKLYQFDFPGRLVVVTDVQAIQAKDYSNNFKRSVMRMNADEFVRVKLDGSSFGHDKSLVYEPTGLESPTDSPAYTQAKTNSLPYAGSRASELIAWRSWVDFQWNGTSWIRTANAGGNVYNEITLGAPRDLNSPNF